jgi:hypothetical protein
MPQGFSTSCTVRSHSCVNSVIMALIESFKVQMYSEVSGLDPGGKWLLAFRFLSYYLSFSIRYNVSFSGALLFQ